MSEEKQLSDEDMARVEQYLNSGYNDTERKPFRPLRMMLLLLVVVSTLSALSMFIAKQAGIF
jgi:hypothetical protein